MSDETSIVRTIGRYHVLEEIGRGGMSVVYRGFDPVIGRPIALKTIGFLPEDDEAGKLRQRLYREASAAGTLTHPNIVTVYDVLEDGRTTAVAMELIEGHTLAAVIRAHGPLPLDRAIEILEHVCSALDYAGSKGLVHRDIKPTNIMFTAEGRTKVMDFGIARTSAGSLTQTGTIMGSPSYMSPEQVRGLPLDTRSDLFSAAAVFYEMITGERPFGGDDAATTMYRIVNEPPRAVEELNASISPAVVDVIRRALTKDPSGRYASGAELVAELKRAAGVGTGSYTASVAAAGRAGPRAPTRRSPILRYGGVALVGLLLFAAALFKFGEEPVTDSTTAPPDDGQTAIQAESLPVSVRLELPSAPPVAEVALSPAPPAVQGPVSTVPPPSPTTPAEPKLPPPAESPVQASPREPPRREPPRPAVPAAVSPAVAAPAGVPASGEATVSAEFDGQPYPVTLYAGEAMVGRFEGAGGSVTVEAGSVQLRAVSDAVFLNADVGTFALRPGERRMISLPGTSSAVLSVKGEDYAGVRILIDGQQLPGPYPAQVRRIAAGVHRVVYRWISGPAAGRELGDALTIPAGRHFLIRAVPDDGQIVVQQLR